MKILKFLLLVLFTWSLFSCSESKIQNEYEFDLRNIDTFDFSIYGTSHNNLLDYVTTLPDFNSATRQDIFEFGNTYSDEFFTKTDSDWQTHDNDFELILYLVNNPDNICDTLFTLGLMSSSETDLCDRLIEAIDQSNLQDILTDLDDLQIYIEDNFPIEYVAQTKEGNFAARFMAGIETAKSSLMYWNTVSSDINHPWHYRFTNEITTNLSQDNIQLRFKWPKWIKVAVADIGGFFSAGHCSNNNGGGIYTDLGCCWDNAVDKSDSVP